MRRLLLSLPLLLLVSCETDPEGPVDPPEPPPQVEFLDAPDHLTRASLALRAKRPSADDLRAVQQDSGVLETLVDGYVQSDEFGEMIRDMHGETLLMRSERIALPSMGPLFGIDQGDVFRALAEAPLRLIEDIVMADRPYTEIVQADYTMANEISATIWGLDYLPGGDEWQALPWALDPSPVVMDPPGPSVPRPAAGILSSSELWLRHYSNGSNYHRARANLIARSLLCSDFLGRDVPISGSVDLSDDEAVADAVNTQKECVGCHQSLDPLGAYLWPFRQRISQFVITQTYLNPEGPCDDPNASAIEQINCYPLLDYTTSSGDGWQRRSLRAPGYYGLPADGLDGLGQQIADDPRFSMCAARRFYGYLGQVDVEAVPFEVAAQLQQVFADSGYSARALAKAVVLSDAFRASHITAADETEHIAGLQVIRPRHYGRMIEDLTGFEWRIKPDSGTCGLGEIYRCWGEDDLSAGSAFGFTAMAGGIDSQLVIIPTHTMTPIRALFYSAMASEAAGYIVPLDAAESSPGGRALFTTINSLQTSDESAVREQLSDLHLRILGEFAGANSVEVDESYSLFVAAASQNGGATEEAWKVVLTALFQTDRAIFY
jgi:hypothetical protein